MQNKTKYGNQMLPLDIKKGLELPNNQLKHYSETRQKEYKRRKGKELTSFEQE